MYLCPLYKELKASLNSYFHNRSELLISFFGEIATRGPDVFFIKDMHTYSFSFFEMCTSFCLYWHMASKLNFTIVTAESNSAWSMSHRQNTHSPQAQVLRHVTCVLHCKFRGIYILYVVAYIPNIRCCCC
jgi:hypothetical protein